MTFTPTQLKTLLAALTELERGDARRFEDILWLELGDEWSEMRSFLTRQGFVEAKSPEPDDQRLTSRGLKFLQGLRGHASARSAGAQARRPSAEVLA